MVPRRLVGHLFVVADTATKITRRGNEGHLGNGGLVGARCGKHVANLGNLTFRFLRCCVEFWAEHFTGRVLEVPDIGPQQLLYGSNELAVADVEAEWIEVTVLKATLSLVERRQRGVLVRLYSG